MCSFNEAETSLAETEESAAKWDLKLWRAGCPKIGAFVKRARSAEDIEQLTVLSHRDFLRCTSCVVRAALQHMLAFPLAALKLSGCIPMGALNSHRQCALNNVPNLGVKTPPDWPISCGTLGP